MRYTYLILALITSILYNCNTSKKSLLKNNNSQSNLKESDTIRIANDDLEYEIIIFDIGFNYWLNATARPRGFYDKKFMESRNILFVNEWNQRVLQPLSFDPTLYELRIDFDPKVDYGYEVNYLLYNYFIYFQLKYNQRLTSILPRI